MQSADVKQRSDERVLKDFPGSALAHFCVGSRTVTDFLQSASHYRVAYKLFSVEPKTGYTDALAFWSKILYLFTRGLNLYCEQRNKDADRLFRKTTLALMKKGFVEEQGVLRHVTAAVWVNDMDFSIFQALKSCSFAELRKNLFSAGERIYARLRSLYTDNKLLYSLMFGKFRCVDAYAGIINKYEPAIERIQNSVPPSSIPLGWEVKLQQARESFVRADYDLGNRWISAMETFIRSVISLSKKYPPGAIPLGQQQKQLAILRAAYGVSDKDNIEATKNVWGAALQDITRAITNMGSELQQLPRKKDLYLLGGSIVKESERIQGNIQQATEKIRESIDEVSFSELNEITVGGKNYLLAELYKISDPAKRLARIRFTPALRDYAKVILFGWPEKDISKKFKIG